MAFNKKDKMRITDLLRRHGYLKSEREDWRPQWQELSRFILPNAGRYFIEDRNKGHNRTNNIYDNTATLALRNLSAGMMSGATSPSRPWFKLGTSDPDLNNFHSAKIWLHDMTQRMSAIFQSSNTYRTLHSRYNDLGVFGTASSLLLFDFDKVIHHYPSTIGEYCISTDYKGTVNTYYREFQKTVAELVKEFGYDNCSTGVRSMWDAGTLDTWVTVIHAIEPRGDRDLSMEDNKNMPFASYYFELGGDGDQFLREGGFKIFPVLAPRWDVTGGDIYGRAPGMTGLGDVKQLQHEQLRKAQAIDLQTDPPLQVPAKLKNRGVQRLPGGITYVDGAQGQSIKTMFDVNLDLRFLREDIEDVRGRIRSAFFSDLFLMMANATDTRMTATEVAERHEEKLLMLGPVIERLHNELLSPLIEITFAHMVQAGIVPPPPKELQGVELNVEYVSILAQAQKAIGTNGVDRFTNKLGEIATFKPDVLDKFDADKWADSYSDMLGVDPNIIIANDQVALIRQTRAEAEAAQAQIEAQKVQSETAKNLSESNTGGDSNALTDIMSEE